MDIFIDNKIHYGVTPASFGRADHWNTESEAEHNEAYEAHIEHIKSFPSFEISGSVPTNWKDGDDVTGLYNKVSCDCGIGHNCKFGKTNKPCIVALPLPSEREKKLRLEDYPNLIEMKNRVDKIKFGTVEYWKERCNFLEKHIDPTYGDFERSNCFNFYRMLVKKEK